MATRSARSARRGTRRTMRGRGGSSKIARSRRGGGTMSFAAKGGRLTGRSRHGPSIKKPNTYEALRRKGYSKAKAARISNAQFNGTINHRGRGRKGGSRRRGTRNSMS